MGHGAWGTGHGAWGMGRGLENVIGKGFEFRGKSLTRSFSHPRRFGGGGLLHMSTVPAAVLYSEFRS